MVDTQLTYSIAQDLPFDILQEIFEFCLPDVENPELDHQPNSSVAPLLLCHICVSWRTAALSMSSIWKSTTFTIYTTRRMDPQSDRLLLRKATRFIAWWKKHLGYVTPSLYLPWPPSNHGRQSLFKGLDDVNTSLFDGPFFRSAHSLRLTIMNQELDIICSNPSPFPNLVELRIESVQDSRMPRIPPFPFPPAPHLAHLQLSHAESFKYRTLNIFPWGQLTHLYIPRTLSIDSWKALIQRCDNLKVAAVIMSGTDPDVPGASPIVVDNLRQLVAASNSMRTGIPFYGIVFPQLTAFRLISGYIASRISAIEPLEQLLSTMPALKELHIDSGLAFTEDEYLPFDQVQVHSGRRLSAYLPHLQHLVIDYIDPSSNNVGKNIINFLKSEWLCSGWESLGPSGSEKRRKLELVVSGFSHTDHQPIPDKIVVEVSRYLDSEWADDAPFVVSIYEEEVVKGYGRSVFDVFDEKMPSRGWDKAVDFYTTS